MWPSQFLAPERLWWGLLLGVLVVGYGLAQRRRKAAMLKFTRVDLVVQASGRSSRWRRHVGAVGLALVAMTFVVAFAKPATSVRVPRELASVMLSMDVSLSMQADDVSPNRLRAAQDAAKEFVSSMPPGINVGLVSFAGTATVLVPPTTDRERVKSAISGLQLAESTAIGEGILTSLEALKQGPVSGDGKVPRRVVLLSDGERTTGRTNEEAIAAAKQAEVPVSTIAFGTSRGVVHIKGTTVPVPVGERDMKAIAKATNGKFYQAQNVDQLREVYSDIGSAVGYVVEPREITDRWVGLGLALLVLVFGLSLALGTRIP